MTNTLTFPAFRNNGVPVQLAEVLAVIPENNLVWSILEFDGIGEAPNNLTMDEFEQLVRKRPGGLVMSWSQLRDFSERISQTIDCVVVGARSDRDILSARRAGDYLSSCEVVLEMFDSTEWTVWALDTGLMQRFASICR